MVNKYDIGDVVRVSLELTAAGVAVDPAGLKFKYRMEKGTVTTLVYGTDAALVKDSTGHYHVDITATEQGRLFYRGEASGTNAAAEEGFFIVKESKF